MSCEHCGREKQIPLHRQLTFRFCSYKCHWDWKSIHDRVPVSCAICHKEFTVIRYRQKIAKYCSRKCYYRSLRHKGSVEIACDWCAKPIRKTPSHVFLTNYCSQACYTNGQSTKKRVKLRGVCEVCGWKKVPKILVVHHRDRNPKRSAIDNLQLLCWNCHMVEHFRCGDGPYNSSRHRVD